MTEPRAVDSETENPPKGDTPEAVAEESQAQELAAEDGSVTEGGNDEETGEGESAEELRLMLEDARAKSDEHWDQVLRLKAEMDNLRKRHERDVDAARKFALDSFVAELLQVRDSLELGNQAAAEENAELTKVREGTELTLKLLGDVMSKFGVEQIDPLDQPFDPERHQAMSTQPRDDVPPNTVVAVMQKGYSLNGRLVRPAMVFVSKAP